MVAAVISVVDFHSRFDNWWVELVQSPVFESHERPQKTLPTKSEAVFFPTLDHDAMISSALLKLKSGD
jgi:hypothetical protein